MTAPLVIHAGFHKTGTSSVQAILRANRALLKPHMAIALKPRLRDLLHAARGYSTWRDPLTLAKFAHRAEAFLATLPGVKRRGLLLSAEELCGHMPGRKGIDDYGAAPILLAEFAQAAARLWPAPDLRFMLTTRDAQAWLESSYWEHVKSSSLTQDFTAYAARIAPAADLAGVVTQIARATGCPAQAIPLKQGGPMAATRAILAPFDLPADTLAALTPVAAQNTRPDPALLARLLHINRTISDRAARKEAKQALLRGR